MSEPAGGRVGEGAVRPSAAGAGKARAAPRRVAVVGATGSVGRQVCAAFLSRGHEVLAIARNPASHLTNVAFRAVDVAAAETSQLAELFETEGVDAVVNAAGRWGPTEAEMVYSHLRAAERLLAALALLPRPMRIVHLGSVHEYGPVPVGALIDESLPPRPANSYARTKLAVAQAVLSATRLGEVEGVVLRMANMFGPYPAQETFLASLVGRLRAAAASGKAVELGIADARRDFVDVRDVAAAVLAATAAAEAAGRVVNIGSGTAVELRELVDLLVAITRIPPGLVTVRSAEVESKGGDWTRMDIRLARRLLGWRPRYGVRESLHAMWESSGPVTSPRRSNERRSDEVFR
jgi:NDP-hexose 4-ketoreductase